MNASLPLFAAIPSTITHVTQTAGEGERLWDRTDARIIYEPQMAEVWRDNRRELGTRVFSLSSGFDWSIGVATMGVMGNMSPTT